MGPPRYNPPAVQAQTNQYGYLNGNVGQPGSNPGGSLPPATTYNIPPNGMVVQTAGGTLPGLGTGATTGNSPSNYIADPTSYGGAVGGPQAWTNYYQGLGQTAAGQVGAQRTQAMGAAGAAMNPYSAYGQANSAAWNGAAAGSQGMGSLAQQQLAAAGSGQDQVSRALQAQANGTGPNVAASTLGQGAAAGIHAQLAAAASTRGGAAMQAAAGQGAAIQNAAITGQAAGNAANATAQAQLQGQQELAQYTQGAQTGLAGAANTQLGTAGNLGLGYGNLGEGAAATGLQVGTQAGEAYSTEQLQAQQAYEQMAQQTNQNQLQAQIAARGQSLGLQGTQMQVAAQQQGQLIGGATTAGGTLLGLAAMSDENAKTGIAAQGDASPGDGAAQAGAPPVQGAGGLSKDQLKAALGYFRGQAQPTPAPTYTPNGGVPQGGMQPMSPGMVSDERAKTAVAPAPTADALLQMLAKSKATYQYKNPADQPLSPQHPRDPNARFGGVMAQDLERVPEIGRQLVTDTPRGKMVEPAAGLSAVMMGLGRLHERLSALEGARR
jgi:hypothetical protein